MEYSEDRDRYYKALGKYRELVHVISKQMELVYWEGVRLTEYGPDENLAAYEESLTKLTNETKALLRQVSITRTAFTVTELREFLPASPLLRNHPERPRILAEAPSLSTLPVKSVKAPPPDQCSPTSQPEALPISS